VISVPHLPPRPRVPGAGYPGVDWIPLHARYELQPTMPMLSPWGAVGRRQAFRGSWVAGQALSPAGGLPRGPNPPDAMIWPRSLNPTWSDALPCRYRGPDLARLSR
jgi:hypothetical protein